MVKETEDEVFVKNIAKIVIGIFLLPGRIIFFGLIVCVMLKYMGWLFK